MNRRSALRDAKASLTLRLAFGSDEWAWHERDPGATVFHSWDWLSWIAPLMNCRFVPLVVERDDATVGIAPMLVRPHLGAYTANLVPFPYLGPVVSSPYLMAPTAALLKQWATRHRVVRGKQGLGPTAQVASGCFSRAGLVEEVNQTYLVDLRGRRVHDVLESFTQDVANGLRCSVNHGVSIRTSTPDDLRNVLPLVLAQSLWPTPTFVSRLGDSLASGPPPVSVRCATAVIDGRAVGLSVSIGGAGAGAGAGAVRLIGGVLHDNQPNQANTALIRDAIQWAHVSGYPTLDLLGAPSPDMAALMNRVRPRVEDYRTGEWQLPGVGLVDKTFLKVVQPSAMVSAGAIRTVRDRAQRGAGKPQSL